MTATPAAVDLNADVGEGLDDELLMPHLTSVSVACGGHAGDVETMARTVTAAHRHGLRVGAHPGYPDRERFGRVELEMAAPDLTAALVAQLGVLRDVAAEQGVRLTHVKAHGALYNRAWKDRDTAEVVVRAVIALDPGWAVFCPSGSAQEAAARDRGLEVIREVFLDRGYSSDGTLVPRGQPGDIVTNPLALPGQISTLQRLQFETMCVHGDNPAALRLLQAAPALLASRGWRVAPYSAAG
jgi:UPF0271 protein